MPLLRDRVLETTTSTGTGSINLGGAKTGHRSFSAAFTTGDQVYYTIAGGAEWEVGIGTVTTGAPWTLSRTTVLSSSNANALVNFSAGTKEVFNTAPAYALEGGIQFNPITQTATASQTVFNVIYNVGYIMVFQNGVLLTASDYTAVSGSTVVLNTGATVGDELSFLVWTKTNPNTFPDPISPFLLMGI
jgi:hypothetical protein